MKLLSVIVPCYNEEENVRDFYDELCKNTDFFHEKQIEFEILYVDDGSKDQTVSEVKKLHKEDGRVRLISFSAILARRRRFMRVFRSAGEILPY